MATVTLQQRMDTIVSTLVALGLEKNIDWRERLEAQDTVYRQVMKIDKEVGDGVQVGKLVKFQVADGYAMYWVTEVKDDCVMTVHLPFFDAYTSIAVREDGMIPMYIAEQVIKCSDGLRKMFGNSSLDE